MQNWRLELLFKTESELRAKTIPLLRSSQVQRVNITNKAKEDRLLEAVRILKAELPEMDICVHFSCKYNFVRTVEASYKRLEVLAGELSTLSGASLLLVSGGGKKKALDSVMALQLAAERKPFRQLAVPLYVAFNPYLPGESEQEEERARLRAKVLGSRGLVEGVYLQMGTDIARLVEGLEFLRQLQAEAASRPRRSDNSSGDSSRESLQILGSVFIPSKRLLAQMRFRPWSGVFLSEEYLGSVEAAEGITRELLGVYARHGVAPVVESAVRSEVELARVKRLLGCG